MLPQILCPLILLHLFALGIIFSLYEETEALRGELSWLWQHSLGGTQVRGEARSLAFQSMALSAAPQVPLSIILLFVFKEFLDNQSWRDEDTSLLWRDMHLLHLYSLIYLPVGVGCITQIWGIQIIGGTAGSSQEQIHHKKESGTQALGWKLWEWTESWITKC